MLCQDSVDDGLLIPVLGMQGSFVCKLLCANEVAGEGFVFLWCESSIAGSRRLRSTSENPDAGHPVFWLGRREEFGLVFGRQRLGFGPELGLRGLIQRRRRGGASSDRNPDLGEEFLLPGRRADAEQAHRLVNRVAE